MITNQSDTINLYERHYTRNIVSIWAEFGPMVEAVSGRRVPVQFEAWRPGDQRCYISDIRRAARDMGWVPEVSLESGIEQLWEWVHPTVERDGVTARIG